jgi:hypothetical protein
MNAKTKHHFVLYHREFLPLTTWVGYTIDGYATYTAPVAVSL